VSTGYTWPYRSNLPFLISDTRAIWCPVLSASDEMSEIKNVG